MITSAQYANDVMTAVNTMTDDRGIVTVFQEHPDQWDAMMNELTTRGIPIEPFPLPDPRVMLKLYAADKRWFMEDQGGIVVGGIAVKTDVVSQSKIDSAYSAAKENSAWTTDWKDAYGNFIRINAAQIINIAAAVHGYVEQCYHKEALAVEGVNNGTVNSRAEIDVIMQS